MKTRPINFIHIDPEHSKKPEKKRQLLFLFGITLALFFIGGCIVQANATPPSNNPAAYDPVTLEPKQPETVLKRISHLFFRRDATLEGEKDDRVNILLLGMGGLGHEGPFLTDTIIITSIEPSTGQVAMVSIPRDLGVEIPGHGWRKINTASAFGEAKKKLWGGALATEVIENTFDLNIHYYARVDFKAFSEIIDAVGGVTVNVDRSFTDPLFPAPNFEYQTVQFTKGLTELNGEHALEYARSRHGNNGEGSDFARAKRQQKMILALKEKVLSFSTLSNPIKIHNVITALDSHITTNMEFADIMSLLKLARAVDMSQLSTVVLDTSVDGYLINGRSPEGAFILEPRTGDFEEIRSMVKNIFALPALTHNDTPLQDQPTFGTVRIEIQNGTWHAGLAARVKKQLQKEGFLVPKIGNADERPQSFSGMYQVGESSSLGAAETLKELLSIPIKKLSETLSFVSTTDILIVLGDDFIGASTSTISQ